MKGKPLFLNTQNELWYGYVNTFIELKTNHRFGNDPEWGKLLQKVRKEKLTKTELGTINSRVVNVINEMSENDVPHDAVYATKTNKDKAAINDGIFAKFVSETHRNINCPPMHTICIKASNILFQQNRSKHYKQVANKLARDIIYSACNDSHIKDSSSKRFDPMLKLYIDRPLMINNNIDVKNCIANGAMCKFKGIVLKDMERRDSIHKIKVDGCYVNCVEACDVQSLVVER